MISFNTFISEARKNPELNPKTSINDLIIQHYNSAPILAETGIKNSFVSFTRLDKLGINPKSKYNTPLGIYCYPTKYIIDEIKQYLSMDKLPFAGEFQFANIFTVSGNVLNLTDMSRSTLESYYKKFTEIYLSVAGINKNDPEWKSEVDKLETIYEDAGTNAKFNSPGGKFWNISMELARWLLHLPKWHSKSHPISWNALFRELDIAGCVDTGVGIIHTAEPTQAVFFSSKFIKNIKRYENKYSPEHMTKMIKYGQKQIDRKAQLAEFTKKIKSGDISFINDYENAPITDPNLRRVLKELIQSNQNKFTNAQWTAVSVFLWKL